MGIAKNKIIQLVKSDLNNLAEVRLWDQLCSYGDVSLYYMNHTDVNYQYTCYVCGQYNTCSDYAQRAMQQTLKIISDCLWDSINTI